MLKIRTEAVEPIEIIHKQDVRCPSCGRKLSEVSYVKGVVLLRIKCPKCRTFVNIDITGN